MKDHDRDAHMLRLPPDGVPRLPVPMLGCGFTAEDVIDHQAYMREDVAPKLRGQVEVRQGAPLY